MAALRSPAPHRGEPRKHPQCQGPHLPALLWGGSRVARQPSVLPRRPAESRQAMGTGRWVLGNMRDVGPQQGLQSSSAPRSGDLDQLL